MTFIEVKHGGLDTEGAQGADAADAEDHLLANSRRFITTVQAMGNVAIRRGVLATVRIEEVDGDTSNLRLPDARIDVATSDAYYDFCPLSVRPSRGLDG